MPAGAPSDLAFLDPPIIYARTPLLPAATAEELTGEDWRDVLLTVLRARPELRLAIHIASTSLGAAMDLWLSSGTTEDRVARRVLAYALRAATRTTPFGLFAAVSHVDAGASTLLTLDQRIRTVTRVGMGWLAGLLATWKADRALRRCLRVTINDNMLLRGDRFTVYDSSRVRTANRTAASMEYVPVSLKATAPVHFLVENVTAPQSLEDLAMRLAEKFGEPLDDCFDLLDQLWETGFFVDELRIDPTTDPCQDIIDKVRRIDEAKANLLASLVADVTRIDDVPLDERTTQIYSALHERQEALSVEAPGDIQTDSARNLRGTLGANVLADVQRLAALATRNMRPELKRYRQRFIDRYDGTTREVPLLELVHPALGLGVPEDLTRPPMPKPLSERRLLLAAHALMERRHEVVLSEDDLGALLPDADRDGVSPAFDLGFEVIADSEKAIDDGTYLIASSALAATPWAGSALGRFAHVLGKRSVDDLQRLNDAVQQTQSDRAVTEVIIAPSRARALNVAIRPRTAGYRVPVGLVQDDENTLRPEDLVVGLDEDGFYVRSLRLRKRLLLSAAHVLNVQGMTPTIGRLLSLIARDGVLAPLPFDWDAAAELPFLPRLRCGRIVISRARWRFSKRELMNALDGSPEPFMERWMMPGWVELLDADNRLTLNLRTAIGRALLRDHISSAQPDAPIILEERLSPSNACWIRDEEGAAYRAEFVASIVRTTRRRVSPVAPEPPPSHAERVFPPGSGWTYFKLYVEPDEIDQLIRHHIAPEMRWLQEHEFVDRWFFIRYQDPESHVRLRVKPLEGARSATGERLHAMLARLVQSRVVGNASMNAYEREIERYGGSEGMAACERFFSADSDLVCAQLRERPLLPRERIASAASSVARIALTFAKETQGAYDALWLTRLRLRLDDEERRIVRDVRAAIEGGDSLPPRVHAAVATLATLDREQRLRTPLAHIIDSLVHMHCNRAGIDPAQEERVRAIARQAILSLNAQRER